MRDLQKQVLGRNIDRLSEVLQRAERRSMLYSEESRQRTLDFAFVERLAVCLHQLKKFQREHSISDDREELMGCLKDAITQLHELCDFTRSEIEELDQLQERIFEKEERWVRMLNVSLIGLFVNICADNIRYGLEEIDRHVQKLNNSSDPATPKPARKTPHLYIVK